MTDAAFVTVGRVVKTHGLKGEVSVVPTTETSVVVEGLRVWFVPPVPGSAREGTVVSVRRGPKGPLVAFDSVKGIDAAAALVGRDLLARSEDLPADVSDDTEPDVTGYQVIDPRHGDIGAIVETLITGANDVWVVEGPFGEVLIPVIEQVVIDIDDAAEKITVNLLDGLLPEGGRPR